MFDQKMLFDFWHELPADDPLLKEIPSDGTTTIPTGFHDLFNEWLTRRKTTHLQGVPTRDAKCEALDATPESAALMFLSQSHGDRPRHLVAINPEGGAGSVIAKTFEARDIEVLLKWIATMNKRRHWGIYYHVNELKADCHDRRAKKTDIASAHFVHVDVDDPGAAERIKAFNPSPTVTVFSGGGFNCLWRIDPTSDIGAVENINRAIEHTLNADHCHNIDCILRLPGTINYPNAKKKAKGRTSTQAYIVEGLTDWTRDYELSAFDHLQRPQPEQPKPEPIKIDGPPREPIADHIMDIVERGAPEGERSHAFFDVMKHLKECGYTVHEVYDLLGHYPNGIANKYWDRLLVEIERTYSKIHQGERADGTGHPPRDPLYATVKGIKRIITTIEEMNQHFAYLNAPLTKNAFVLRGETCSKG